MKTTRPGYVDWNCAHQIVYELTGQASKAQIERVMLLMRRARENLLPPVQSWLELIRLARQAHEDAGPGEFHQGAVAVCEELERAGGETS